jgi:RNA polymerase sigma factor (sigma-70 family)
MTPDPELLRQFAQTNSEAAFAELVKRHVNLVYSAALRQVNGDAHFAQDVAQTVFTDLARKAASLAHRESLTGWLYTSAHFAAAKTVRTENRRRDREEKFMREPTNDRGMSVPPVQSAPETDWENLRSMLDAAMHELKETDREAVLLRYFENRPFAEVGAKLVLNENAARMRVERALEKLREIFAKRGITTATALASVISANAIQMAPANLAATLTTTSIAGIGTGTFTLLKIMTATKLKLTFSALVVVGATTAFIIQHQAQEKLRAENESLQQQNTQLEADIQGLTNRLSNIGDSQILTDKPNYELLKLRGEVGALRRQADEAEQNLTAALSVQAKFAAIESTNIDAIKYLGLAMRIYAGDHNNQFPSNEIALYKTAQDFDGNTNLLQELPAIEYLNTGAAKFISQNTLEYPNMVMVRERIARQAPDGMWHRAYLFADGSEHIATSYDGNFDAWEKANTYSPPPNQ